MVVVYKIRVYRVALTRFRVVQTPVRKVSRWGAGRKSTLGVLKCTPQTEQELSEKRRRLGRNAEVIKKRSLL
jgi:hypothetical protein